MKKILLFVMICSAGLAVDAPKGAFGINFGSKLSELNILKETTLTNGNPLYRVQPPSPMNLLDTYYVLVTPKSNEVYEIWGDKDYSREERAKCKTDKNSILALLENKYGEFKRPQFTYGDIKEIEIDNVAINIDCRNSLNDNLSLRYQDLTILDKAEKEAKELTIETTDSSML